MKREIHVCDGVGCGKPLLSHSDGLVFKGELLGPTDEKVFEAPADQEVALCWSCLEKTKPTQVIPFIQPVIPTSPEYPGITHPYPGIWVSPHTTPIDRIIVGDPPQVSGPFTASGTGPIKVSAIQS